MDECFKGSHAQTTQHKLVLEGTPTARLARHLSQTDAFSISSLAEFCESGLENISLLVVVVGFFFFLQRSKQFRANGRNVSYVVSMQKLSGVKGKVCSTGESYCTFQLPWRANKVYLSAVNAAGRSNPTEAQIHLQKGKPDVLISGRTALKKKEEKKSALNVFSFCRS